MPRYEYRRVDVLTTERFGGNPLAVFPDARGLDAAAMRRIANEFNLSETTFVAPSERADCDFRLRVFTPRAELPMAGHPTIGTAWVLSHGNRVVFEEGVGPVPPEDALEIRCEQGVELGRPSAIEIEAFGTAGSPDVHVGGACVDVGGGWIDV